MTRLLRLAALALLAGCPQTITVDSAPDLGPAPAPIPTGDSAEALIGPEGGSLSIGELRLDIPAGALAEATTVRVVATSDAPPPAFTAFSPVFRFEPAGLRFARPVQVTLPYDGNPETATVFWTLSEAEHFSPRPTTTDGFFASTTTTHFSQAFVGTSCNDCCRRATGALDLLLMVDNSGSMTEEQASLATEIPRMVRALATGDIDGDGVQDAPAVDSLQVGVITSDMGTGPAGACGTTFGDDGVLRRMGDTTRFCDPTYPAWLTFASGDDASLASRHVACVATGAGIGGCGFEQQLEASLKALTRATSSIRFAGGTTGHADGANAGFLRNDAVLAIVNLTDEDDCSAVNPELFEEGSPMFDPNLNLRCFNHPDQLHPISRYVDGLLALKPDATQVVFANIVGIPPDLESARYDDMLADRRMIERPDPGDNTRLVTSCEVPGRGVAFPPRRMVRVAMELEDAGAKTAVTSICNTDFGGAIRGILDRVGDGISGACD